MNKCFVLGAVIVLISASESSATTLRASALFQADSSNVNGFTCIDSNSTGAFASCSGTRYYYDALNDVYLGYDYQAQAEASSSALRTRTSLSNTAPVDLLENGGSYDPASQMPSTYRLAESGALLDDRFDENYDGVEYVFTPENDRYSTTAQAGFRDTVTINGGGAGTTGQLVLKYNLDGTNLSETVPFLDQESPSFASTSSSHSLSVFESGVTNVLPDGTTTIGRLTQGTTVTTLFNESVDAEVDLVLAFTFGSAFDLNVLSTSFSSVSLVGSDAPPSLFSTSSEFFSTAALTGISVLDEFGTSIDFFIDSASDDTTLESFSTLDVPANDANVVPLPGALPLLLAGLGGFAVLRGRRHA
jgi:hypothetical protein